ncbi:hypothetical protein M9H77_01859 [Catharanthus roseus]|uniref:Uncharacterized protein n=1 Tax=Catharanthus roseus TaxID=4058 RepID=A0ACC0C6S1_CATRO|nr:hypothetical protein M9H77_01859 [Catharanthus roseus]
MLCGSGYFLAGWVRRGPPARVAQGGLAENLNVRTVYLEYKLVLTTGCRNLSEDPVSGSGLCPLSLSWCMHVFFLKFQVSWQHRCVLIRSNFSATPEPFRKFIFCIKVLKALTLLG